MRVLTVGNMYPPHHLGGYELTWQSSVRHLRSRGHAVRVVTTDFRLDSTTEPDELDVHRELHWYWHDHRWPRMTPLGARQLEKHNSQVLERHLRELSPDVVCWWALGGMSVSLIERVRAAGIPAVGVVGDDWMGYAEVVDKWHRWRRRFGASPLTLDHVRWLFNSDRTLREARRLKGSLADAAVMKPGIDTSLFREASEAEGWRWRMLYVGRIDERKGIRLGVEALAHLPSEATLRVIGGGDQRERKELRDLSRRLGVDSRVTFDQMPRSKLPTVYADADVVLFPVLWEEPWGLVPLEAMGVGRPVIASGRGGTAEYLRGGENALLFSADEGGSALADSVRRLARDPELRHRLRAAGFETAAEYTESAYNDAIETNLREAARAD